MKSDLLVQIIVTLKTFCTLIQRSLGNPAYKDSKEYHIMLLNIKMLNKNNYVACLGHGNSCTMMSCLLTLELSIWSMAM